MEKDSTLTFLRETIRSWERGKIFFISDFAAVENQWGVRFGLSSLAKEGCILRLARGIYCYPELVGENNSRALIPGADTIAYALAAKERFRIIPYGDQAAYRLGLSGFRISDLKYLTDGAPRHIFLSDGKKIYFNHTSEVKMFDFHNETMQLISSAIRHLGKEAINEDCKIILREHMKRIPREDFLKDIGIPPAWVGKLMTELWEEAI